MEIYNAELEPFINYLLSFELSGKNSRMRTRLCKLLGKRQVEVEEERMLLLKENCNLDDKGEIKVVYDDELKREVYDVVDRGAFKKEFASLMAEKFIYEIDENTIDMFNIVKEIVLNDERVYKGQEAIEYDRYCEIVETI